MAVIFIRQTITTKYGRHIYVPENIGILEALGVINHALFDDIS